MEVEVSEEEEEAQHAQKNEVDVEQNNGTTNDVSDEIYKEMVTEESLETAELAQLRETEMEVSQNESMNEINENSEDVEDKIEDEEFGQPVEETEEEFAQPVEESDEFAQPVEETSQDVDNEVQEVPEEETNGVDALELDENTEKIDEKQVVGTTWVWRNASLLLFLEWRT